MSFLRLAYQSVKVLIFFEHKVSRRSEQWFLFVFIVSGSFAPCCVAGEPLLHPFVAPLWVLPSEERSSLDVSPKTLQWDLALKLEVWPYLNLHGFVVCQCDWRWCKCTLNVMPASQWKYPCVLCTDMKFIQYCTFFFKQTNKKPFQ